MKWITVVIGAIIIIGGVWLLFQPKSADGPAPSEEAQEEMMMDTDDEGAMMEDGTLTAAVPAPGFEGVSEMMVVSDASEGDELFNARVEYTDNGFSPATVTIQKGETVRFVNNTSRGVWIGGDNHPTHTVYPETSESDCLGTSFDTCRVLETGETWDFTFNQVGEWGYHNHVRARDKGVVVVTE